MKYLAVPKNNKSNYLYDFIKKKVDLSEFIERETGCSLEWMRDNIEARTICPMPSHSEKKPSFRIKFIEEDGVWIYHCLSGDTRVITWDGVFPIKNLAGSTHKVLTQQNKWVTAPFYSFGLQPVSSIILSRNGHKKEIKATLKHRWFERVGKKRDKTREVLTEDLKKGMRLAFSFPENRLKQIASLSPQGITHGLVFGDGTKYRTMAKIDLWGNKNIGLKKWFPLNRVSNVSRENGLNGITVWDLPYYYKDFPSLDESPSYLSGFLAGWIAADGCVEEDGSVSLSSSKKENLEFARAISSRIGIGTYGINGQQRIGLGKDLSMIYKMYFITSDLINDFFLIDNHRERFMHSSKKYDRKGWVVDSVEKDIGVEEVFCASVEKYSSFTLEDNILTGNCFGCGAKGTIIDFCMEYYGITSSSEAILYLCNKYGFKMDAKLIADSFKDVKKKMDLNRKIECAHIVASNQCRVLLRKNYTEHSKWVSQAYRKMNKALDEEDIDVIEGIGFEASSKMR